MRTVLINDAENMLTLKALDTGLIQHTLTTVNSIRPKTRHFPTQDRTQSISQKNTALAIADAVGVLAITGISWLTLTL